MNELLYFLHLPECVSLQSCGSWKLNHPHGLKMPTIVLYLEFALIKQMHSFILTSSLNPIENQRFLPVIISIWSYLHSMIWLFKTLTTTTLKNAKVFWVRGSPCMLRRIKWDKWDLNNPTPMIFQTFSSSLAIHTFWIETLLF